MKRAISRFVAAVALDSKGLFLLPHVERRWDGSVKGFLVAWLGVVLTFEVAWETTLSDEELKELTGQIFRDLGKPPTESP